MSRRVVMLGLDSLDRVLVKQWIAEGRLPVMAELFAESHKLMLDEANRPLPGGVWTDIASASSATLPNGSTRDGNTATSAAAR